jgi:Tol biopolymer transport system component
MKTTGPADDHPDVVASSAQDSSERLDSWKAIASYLGRSDKTVRRWEEKEGLPVHRLHHDKRGSIYAYKQELDAWWQLRKASIDDVPPVSTPAASGSARRVLVFFGVLAAILGAALCTDIWLRLRQRGAPSRTIHFNRITEFVGLEESPAISPDGKMIVFVARSGARRQLWLRLRSGGAPIQITHDDSDHQYPRWTPDSASLIYYSPSLEPGKEGMLWEIPALGGPPRRIAAALGGADCSHDGKWIALFRSESGKPELVAVERRGSAVRHIAAVGIQDSSICPRWSPNDRWVAFQSTSGSSFDDHINVVPAASGVTRVLARSEGLRGLAWTSDGSAIIYSSASGSTVLYPPVYNLRSVQLNSSADRQLTFGDISYLEPDAHGNEIVVSLFKSESDIWKFPVGEDAIENTRKGSRISRQTGQVQTPSASPDGHELVYLSDSGGHGNLWIMKTDGSMRRQLTFEQDPAAAIGVPVWSPAGDYIVFVLTKHGQSGEWVIHPDGSGLRQLIPAGVLASWSTDGHWIYYVRFRNGGYSIERVSINGGNPVVVRSDNAVSPAATDGSILYYASFLKIGPGAWDFEFRRAHPDNGNYQVMTRITSARVPNESSEFQMILSPNGKWLVTPLTDGTTTNLWMLPADGGAMRQITDFGQRSTLIVRRVSWSPDSKEVYAAVAECDADIVLLEGLDP